MLMVIFLQRFRAEGVTCVSHGSRLSHVSQVRITDKMLILDHNVDDNNKTRLFTTAHDTYEQQLTTN